MVYTIFETPSILVKDKGGTENSISKHIKVPNLTPKSVSNVTISGISILSNSASIYRFTLRYLITKRRKKKGIVINRS